MENFIRIICTSLFFSILLLMPSCIAEEEETGTTLLGEGDQLPYFSVTMDNGEEFSTENLRGHRSVIVFFHTSCPDCQKEFPILQRLYDDYGSKIKILCISRMEDRVSVAKYWADHHLTIPYSAQEDAQVYHLFAKSLIPLVFISDTQLRISAIFTDDPIATYDDLVFQLHQIH